MSSYSTSKTRAIEENKKKTSLLKDNSWIRKTDDEDEPVDRDPNFAKTVLSRVSTSKTIESSPNPEPVKTTKPTSSSTSVNALTKRFSGSTDDLKTIKPSYYTKRYSSEKTETSSTTKTTTVTKDGTTETTVTTTQSVKSPVTKSSTKTETFMERVKSSSKGSQYSPYSPTKTTKPTITTAKDADDELYKSLTPSSVKDVSPTTDSKTTETVTVKSSSETDAEDKLYGSLLPDAITSPVSTSTTSTTKTIIKDTSKDAEDHLYDSLIPSSIKDGDSKTTVSSRETVTVKSSYDVDDTKTTTITTKTSSTPVDDLYGSLLPKGITSPVREESPSTPSSTRSVSYSSYTDDNTYTRSSSYHSDYKPYSYSKPDSSYEYSSLNSPTLYSSSSTYKSSSVSDDILSDPIYSKSSTKSVYQSSDRPVLEKDLCTLCRKPFTGEAKMVLDDIKLNCHATCFKCDICNSSLSFMKAGDSMWLYKRKVHCEDCFERTRDKWRR